MSSESPRDLAGHLRTILDGCSQFIERFTVPLLGLQDNVVKHDRTGVLYAIAHHHFILTAAHHLRAIVRCNIPLFIPQADPSAPALPLMGADIHTTEEDSGRDVAAIRLPDDIVSELHSTKGFLRHSRIDQADDGEGLYVVFGYPEAWTGSASPPQIISHPLIYVSRPYRGQRYPETFYHPDVHIVLEFDQDAIDALEGARVRLPSPKGISGCGIWRVADWRADSIRRWSPTDIRLVALQHRRIADHDRRYVQGTWIKHALRLILDSYPDLGDSMSLVYPRGHQR